MRHILGCETRSVTLLDEAVARAATSGARSGHDRRAPR